MLDLTSKDSFSFVPLVIKPISLTWLLLDFGPKLQPSLFRWLDHNLESLKFETICLKYCKDYFAAFTIFV